MALDAESKRIIEDTLLRFVEENYDAHARRMRLNNPPVDYRQYWPPLAELGVIGMPFSEEQGGISGCGIDVADAVRVLAKGIILEPYIESAVIAGSVLAARAGDAGEAALAALIGGEDLVILVGGRGGLPDALRSGKTAEGYRIDGHARVVPYAAEADSWLLATTDATDGTCRIFKVSRASVPAGVPRYRLMDGRSAADVELAGVTLPADALWLEGDAAAAALDRAASHAASAYCASAVGAMQNLLEITGEYLKTRVQFGVVIGSFQALQHRYANLHMAYLEARAIARKLALALDSAPAEELAWLRFAAASVIERAGALIGHDSIQMHGGMGATDELVVSHYNAHLVVLAKQLRTWIPQDVTLPA